jgi:adenine-specific DNA-methyltransferase
MNIEKLDLQSPDLVNQNIEKIAKLFPNCVTEGADGIKIDFDLLKQELSHSIVEGNKERYRLEWPGKKEAIVTANLPTTKTLRPIREDSVDFDNTQNIYIEGDNLEVLKLLQESYLGKIKMIYIDPPYNTGKDFVYKDNFAKNAQDELLDSGQKDEYNQRLVANPETAGRYHSDWLSMMYPRLKLARNLLTQDGVVFISIDDNEVHNLKRVCDELFGDANFVSSLIWDGGRKNDSKKISVGHEYILVYTKSLQVECQDETIWRERKDGIDKIYKTYDKLVEKYANDFEKVNKDLQTWFNSLKETDSAKKHKHYRYADKEGIYFASDLSGPDDGRKNRPRYEVIHPVTKKSVTIPSRGWRWEESRMIREIELERVHFGKDENSVPNGKVYLKENEQQAFSSVFYKDRRAASGLLKGLMGEKVFDFPKDYQIIKSLINLVVRENETVLDFFSGSGSTAEALMEYATDRKIKCNYIMVQIPESIEKDSRAYTAGYKNICEIGKERIRRAAKKIKEDKITTAKNDGIFADFTDDQDYGFRVYRLDESNMQDVYYKPQDYVQSSLDLFADNVKADRTADDLLTQVILDWGLPLSLKIEKVEISGKQVFKVAENSLFACFDKGIDEDFAKELASEKPLRVVFKDNAFKDDTAKTNVKQLLKQLSPNTEMKVI